jgi:signal transduction histidine kinase/CheY-like chemotaxis protein
MTKSMPIFHRLLLAFLAVGMIIGLPLIYVSFEFSKESARLRTQQSITQQISILAANFDQEFGVGLQRSLKQLASSEALAMYLSASHDERIVNAKSLETSFLNLQTDYDNYSGIYYADGDGRLVASVEDKKRSVSSEGRLADPTSAASVGATTQQHFDRLFARIKTTPSLLSSGNMEWFMPPRELAIEGPFSDEKGRLSLLAGLPSLDFDSGTFSGVVVIRIRLDAFLARLKSVRLYDTSPIWLFSASGATLLKPEPSLISVNPAIFAGADKFGDVMFMPTQDGLLAHQNLSIVPGEHFARIAYAVPASLLVQDFQSALYFFLGVLAVSALAVLVIAYVVARNFSTPIIELAHAASRLARGDLSTRVGVQASGEVLALVNSFNQMSEKLQVANQNRANAVAVLRQTAAQMQSGQELVPRSAENLPQLALASHDSDSLLGQEDQQDLRAISRLITQLVQERIENLEKFREAKDSADRANRTKSEFLAMMSHEIRTPMNGILGTVQLLELSPLSEEQRRDLLIVRNSGDALLILIDGILDFSKIEAGKLELESRDFDPRVELGSALALYRPLFASKALRFEVDIDSSVPRMLRGDSTRIRQILSNLVSNALKFTESGFVRVEISAEPLGPAAVRLKGVVQDSGIGIKPDRSDRLFKAFSQVDVSTTRQYGGTGLGLAISAKLCEAMGGGIQVTSESGSGSTFSFDCQLQIGAELMTAPAGLIETRVPEMSALRVLVVEDHPVNQKIATGLLGKLGISADLATNGAIAVDMASGGNYDVILMDMQMPVMDGVEATRAIRLLTLAYQPWIIAQTANAFDTDRDSCLKAGMNDFLSKPFRMDVLRDKLQKSIRDQQPVLVPET